MIAHPPPPPPARVQVVAQEYSFSLSRRTVTAGRVIIELVNRGQDAHDLDIQRVGANRVFHFPEVSPGHYADRMWRLRPGTYHLWCAVADHAERGMKATLVVRRRR